MSQEKERERSHSLNMSLIGGFFQLQGEGISREKFNAHETWALLDYSNRNWRINDSKVTAGVANKADLFTYSFFIALAQWLAIKFKRVTARI